jgi:hypothetical protein
VDHWIVEFWNGQKWQRADFQIDAMQRQKLHLDFDPLDQPSGRFLTAGRAWQQCRSGQTSASKFGFADESGYFFIAMNIVRDLAALQGYEMLPWDDWGNMPADEAAMTSERMERYDALAALTADPDNHFEELATAWADPELRVPETVFNCLLRRQEPILPTR